MISSWRARAAVESPSHLRAHPRLLMLVLLAALLHTRQQEITDTLVELLISTVHGIGARADKKVTEELVNAFKQVTGKAEHPVRDRGGFAVRPNNSIHSPVLDGLVVRPGASGFHEPARVEFEGAGTACGGGRAAFSVIVVAGGVCCWGAGGRGSVIVAVVGVVAPQMWMTGGAMVVAMPGVRG